MENGQVSRNYCLSHFITARLAARINDLREAGYHIVGQRVKTDRGVDYIYTMPSRLPKQGALPLDELNQMKV